MGKFFISFFSPTTSRLTKYRFGAVLEEFEVRDTLESVFYTKPPDDFDDNA